MVTMAKIILVGEHISLLKARVAGNMQQFVHSCGETLEFAFALAELHFIVRRHDPVSSRQQWPLLSFTCTNGTCLHATPHPLIFNTVSSFTPSSGKFAGPAATH